MTEKKEVIEAKKEEKKKDGRDVDVFKDVNMPKKVTEFFMSMQHGGLPPQILDKITEEHISKALEISEKTTGYVHQDGKSERRYGFAYVVSFLIVVLVLVFSLKEGHEELLKQVLIILVSLAGGFGAGYGYCKHKHPN